MFRWIRSFIIALVLCLVYSGSVLAHANLYLSEPRFNDVLSEAPQEIRLWFTEPVEQGFSHIYLYDAAGTKLEMPAAEANPVAPTQLVMRPARILPDGLYTVVWRVVSAADTHPSSGSFTFTIGAAVSGGQIVTAERETIPASGSLVRWFNLLSLALLTGSLGFRLFVWNPIATEAVPGVEHRLTQLAWAGWIAAGLSGLLLLFNQLAVVTDAPLFAGINGETLLRLIRDTRFGQLWLIRMGLWLWLATGLGLAGSNLRMYWLCLLSAGGMLAMNSLVSHAAGAYDALASMFNDLAHLLATALWVGGLMAFAAVLPPVRRYSEESTRLTEKLVAQFSNFARVAVITLILTGLYSTWLQVGSIDALLNTLYGQLLVIKLLLILPVLALAGINLLLTSKGLKSGQSIWNRRLQLLVGAEVIITALILAVVGMMTSVSPARNTMSLRSGIPVEPAPAPIVDSKTADHLTIELAIDPGWVGDNTFTVTLKDASGTPVEDASRIRMRFESQSEYLAESELRPEHTGGGVYAVSGSNLSVPGGWRIRLTITRPDTFDTVVDFNPSVPVRPAPVLPDPVSDNSMVLPDRLAILIQAALLMTAAGGFFLAESYPRIFSLSGLISGSLLLVAALFMGSALSPVDSDAHQPPVINRALIVRNEWMLMDGASDAGVYMLIDNGTSQADRLIGVTSDAAETVQLHNASLVDGVSRMMPVESLDIPANEDTYLAPGTAHVMLTGLRPDIQTGDTITLTLEFESGKTLTAEVNAIR